VPDSPSRLSIENCFWNDGLTFLHINNNITYIVIKKARGKAIFLWAVLCQFFLQ
jgi:hypothetical protein